MITILKLVLVEYNYKHSFRIIKYFIKFLRFLKYFEDYDRQNKIFLDKKNGVFM